MSNIENSKITVKSILQLIKAYDPDNFVQLCRSEGCDYDNAHVLDTVERLLESPLLNLGDVPVVGLGYDNSTDCIILLY